MSDHTSDARYFDAAVKLAADLAAAEVDAVAVLLSDPARTMPVADAAGLTADHLSQDDLRIIYAACDLGRHLPVITILSAARRALRQAGYWNGQGPIGTGSQWSDETLARLAHTFPFITALVHLKAARLIQLDRRQRAADDLMRRTLAMLDGGDEPALAMKPASRGIVMLPARKRGEA